MPDPDASSDAHATVRFVVFDALVKTSHVHRANPEKLVWLRDTIVSSLFDSPTRWAAKAYAEELDSKDGK